MPNPSPVKRKPRIEPPGTVPRKGDKIVKVKRCFFGRFHSAPVGTRATVVRVVHDRIAHDEGAWTDKHVDGAPVSPSLIEFEARGGWRVCKRKEAAGG